MALTAAQLEAILTLDKSQFERELAGAHTSAQNTRRSFQDWGKDVGKAVNDGIVLTATGAAAMAATVTKVGIDFNTLQQQNRAALETLLGSAEAAEAQMGRLDSWADNSPFAREIFYEAQQQLIGFGVEADLVIPILDGVQDAVAAVGGTNEDITQVVDALSNMQGTGRLTGEELRRLGRYGIDAATIIGDEMGHTGEEIREMASRPGGIPVDQVWEPLTEGLTSRFGGAAENVKDTYVGALDRIKAASRDIGSEIAAPFVDPQGGGRAVDWANDFADLLRAVESQIPSLVGTMDDRLSPAFDNFRIRMKDATDAVNNWDAADLESMLDRLGDHIPTIAGLSGAMFALATQNIPVIGGLTSALGPLGTALGLAALASPEMRDGLSDILSAGEPLIGVLADLAGVASGTFVTGLEASATVLSAVADVVGPVVEWFADLPEPIRNAATAAVIFNAAGRPMADKLTGIGGGIRNVIDRFSGWTGTFEGATASTGDFRAAVGLAAESIGQSARSGLRGAANGIMGLFGGPWGIALMGATALITTWAQESRAAKERADELNATLDEQTGAFTAASEEILASQVLDKIEESQNAVSTFGGELEVYGLTVGDITAAIIDQGDAHEHLKDKIIEGNMEAAGVSDEAGARRLAENAEVWEYVEEQIEAHRVEQEAIEAVREAERERYLAMDEGERSYQRYTEAIGVAVDETITMSDRVNALKDALDELEGKTKTQEERDRDLASTQRDLNGFFKDNAEAIGDMDENLIDMSTGMPIHTELGDRLATILGNVGDDAHEAALEIYDLAEAEDWSAQRTQAAIEEAYQPYIDTLKDLEDQGYLSGEEVDALTDSIIGVPAVTSFIVTHGDSVTDTEKDVLNLIEEIYSVPDGETYISDEGTSQDVIDMLEDLGIEVNTLPKGVVEVETSGIPEAEEVMNDFVNRDRSINVPVTFTMQERLDHMARTGHPALGQKYYGGIDRFKGMAAGGVTGASVMDIAQMVSPGDIRFAGDRSDVDEAWIPLDGSARSIAILEEAMARMPGYNPLGMAAGGITGNLTPPQVDGVEAPDTSDLEQVWQDTMAVLEDSTRSTFDTIEQDTAASQDATTKTTGDQFAQMQAITTQQLALMVAATAANMQAMDADATRYTASMRDATGQNLATMQTDTDARTASMRDTTAARFQAMQQDGSYQADVMRYNVSRQFLDMHTYGTGQAAGLRSDADREFTAMQTHGVDAAGRLRTGVVHEMGQARSPFTGHVNSLVDVMRDFSDAITKSYGDMGVEIGKPSRISAATGTILPGFNPGVDNHIFHSPTGGILELSGGEGVSRPEVVQAMGAGAFNALNAAARTGGVAGVQRLLGANVPRQSFADGGIMDMFTDDAKHIGTEHKNLLPDNWLRPAGTSIIDTVVDGIGEALAAMFSGDGWVRPTTGRVTSRYGAGRGAYPHSGMDIADGAGTPVVAPTAMKILETGWNIGPGRTGLGILGEHMDGLYTYYGHNPVGGIRVKPGDLVTPGERIGAQGNTGNSTGAHLHWEVQQGSPWNDVNPHPFWDAAGGAGSGVVSMPGGGTDMWGGIIMQALRMVGLPTTPAYVNAWLSQGKSESGLNPKARQQVNDINMRMGMPAAGIVQVIPPTFSAYSLPGMKDIFNPLHNFAAGMNYAKNRYGAAGMLNVIGKGHGYEHGTDHALPGWAWVGEAGPELVRFRGGEQVMTNRESVQAVAGGGAEFDYERMGKAVAKHLRPGATVNINHPTTRDTDELARKAAAAFHETLVSSSWGL